jgi:branched-chain amino acid transport system substrate-binding protein
VAAKSADPAAIRDALAATRGFHGITGAMSLTRGGTMPRRQVAIVAVDSRPRLAAVISPVFVPRP